MPTIQEVLKQAQENLVLATRANFDAEERAKQERAEELRQASLKEQALAEEATQLSVFEEVDGLSKKWVEELGLENIISPQYLIGVMAYLWKHPTSATPWPEKSMDENLVRYRREHDKQKKKVKK